jgi:hypothetical protein
MRLLLLVAEQVHLVVTVSVLAQVVVVAEVLELVTQTLPLGVLVIKVLMVVPLLKTITKQVEVVAEEEQQVLLVLEPLLVTAVLDMMLLHS